MSHREIGRENLESSVASSADDSPFIRPPSPVEDAAQPNRPSILNFRGTGSVCQFMLFFLFLFIIFLFSPDACWYPNTNTSTPSDAMDRRGGQ